MTSYVITAPQARPFLPAKFLRGKGRWNSEPAAKKLP
jgi:hypothetical protein